MISGIDYGKGIDESCTVTFVSPEYIKNLEEENNQLKEQKQELRNWLDNQLQEYKETEDERGIVLTSYAIDKLNELSGE